MGRRLVTGCLLACACNAKLKLGDPGSTTDGSNSPDDAAQISDTGGDAALFGPWSTPAPVPGASTTTLDEDDPTLSSTATELYFAAGTTGVPKQLYLMTRQTPTDPWSAPQLLDATFNDPTVAQESPRLSPNDLTIYFGRNGDIYSATRQTVGGAWSVPAPVDAVNTTNYEKWLAVCDNDDFMVSRANGANGQDLYEGPLGTAGVLVVELSSTAGEISTYLSPNCKTVYFASNRGGDGTSNQIYTSTRPHLDSPWHTPTEVDTFGAATDNEDGWLSPDTRTFAFASVRDGATTKDVYMSTR